jgi:RNA polymerase sigma-70 factor (ECF subfamily)
MALGHIWPSARARPGWLAAPSRWLSRQTDIRGGHRTTSRGEDRAQPEHAAHLSASEAGEFEAFVHQFERAILNYLWRMTGDESSAYDLTQEVFLRAWRHFATIRRYEQPHSWLYRVASNLALTLMSTRRRLATPLSDLGALANDAPGASDPAQRFAESEFVQEILLRLPPRRRAALVLREVYGLNTAEVGEALGMSEMAVRKAISRAREQFRALYLEGEGLA